jgi:structural maintenance of chromosome 4
MKNKLEEHQKSLRENERRSAHWAEQIAALRPHNIKELSGGEEADDDKDSLPSFTEDELADLDKDKLKTNIALLEEKIKDVSIDMSVLAEYRRRVEEFTARNNDLQGAVNDRDAVKARLDDLRKRRLEEFMEGFNTISLRLKEMYQMITMGGNAELELVDSLDPFSEGILFSVMPPKKSWKNISNLSGGEKTLSSLALVFALHHYKPTPLYVMDEIDAALDFRNVSIVASYIKERTKNAQFIVISLRNNMFELAARLVGVYKVNHMVCYPTGGGGDAMADFWMRRLRASRSRTNHTSLEVLEISFTCAILPFPYYLGLSVFFLLWFLSSWYLWAIVLLLCFLLLWVLMIECCYCCCIIPHLLVISEVAFSVLG